MNRRASMVDRFRQRARTPAAGLFRRVFVINGLVFTLGTLVLALSPATVSARIRVTEIPVLVVGLAVILAANALLLRSSLAPLDQLAESMRRVDPPRRSDRIDDRRNGDLHHLIASFNAMLDRLETERTTASASALAGQEGERQRIARELHDEIGQSLTVALLVLKRVVDRAPADLRADLHDTQETVRASLDEVRGIARRLRPDTLEDLGLHSALNALCSRIHPRHRDYRDQAHRTAACPAEPRNRISLLSRRARKPHQHRPPRRVSEGLARPARHRRTTQPACGR